MVQVRAARVALDQSGQHVILLKPIDELPGEGRILPIWVADEVLEEAGVPDITGDGDEPEENVEEFKRFLDDVDPDDFRE